MTNHRFPALFGTAAVIAALTAPAKAAETAALGHVAERPALPTPGNDAEAANILGAKLLVCNTCHGGNGSPRNANVPIIWGLQENYLLKQLHDFQGGDRSNDVMTWMTTALTPAELGSAAAYFSKRDWPARTAAVTATTPPSEISVCEACHQQNLVGGVAAPRLASQRYEYLIEQMNSFAEGKRTNSADMSRIMEALSPTEREALARYISNL